MNFRLIKRRKPLVPEPIIPSVRTVKTKYRTGSLIGKFVRHVFDHKNARKVFAGNLALIFIATSFIPTTAANAYENTLETNSVIEAKNTLTTQRSVQLPVATFKLNQSFGIFHPGIDIDGQTGDPIRSIKPGRVIFAGKTFDGYGNRVIIEHAGGLSSLYAHLSKIEVKDGQEVDMNTEIGLVGSTGHSTGSHLHLEIRDHGFPINPLGVLNP